jgi:DNA-binding NarL/FixJ family response regulator
MSIEVLLADDHQVVCDGLEVLLNSESDIHVIHKSRSWTSTCPN